MATDRVLLTVLLLASMCRAPGRIIGAGQDDDKKPLPLGTVSGRVVDPEGKSVKDARSGSGTRSCSPRRAPMAMDDSASGQSSRSIAIGFPF